ncbi:hypothetical protein AA313_de0200527 [Arthrobotrys entomopaga]|nr:hypothetical protein AA313_de0200527 [Arthrobotrys entomopaga]
MFYSAGIKAGRCRNSIKNITKHPRTHSPHSPLVYPIYQFSTSQNLTKKKPKMSQPPPPSSSSSPSKTTIINTLPQVLHSVIASTMKFKERSHKTLHETHIPQLTLIPPSTSPTPVLDIIYLGDSMLERLKTTGANTHLHNLPASINLGVGGDKIENVLYRLNSAYIDLLTPRPTKLWLLHIGSNNLTPKRGLRESAELADYKTLLQCLLWLSRRSKILVTGLFRRKDISDEIVGGSNEGIRRLVEGMNERERKVGGVERLVWVEATRKVTFEELEDQVHLNGEGYRIWDEDVCPRVLELLNTSSSKS